jgi:hypothetical protein
MTPDVEALQTIYNTGPAELDPGQRDALVQRFGWYGRLALVFDAPNDDPARKGIIEPVKNRVLLVILLILVMLVVGGLGGLVMMVVGIVLLATGTIRRRFAPVPTAGAGPPAFLESFAIYIGAWVLYSSALHYLVAKPALWMSMLIVLIIPFAMAWPVVRGLPWREVRFGFGWHRGSGIFLEIVCGIAGYLAGLPLVALGVVDHGDAEQGRRRASDASRAADVRPRCRHADLRLRAGQHLGADHRGDDVPAARCSTTCAAGDGTGSFPRSSSGSSLLRFTRKAGPSSRCWERWAPSSAGSANGAAA